MEHAIRVAKNTGFLYARMGITVFISLYSTRLILDALGESDFGTFNVIAGAIMLFTFLNGAMTTASQRFISFAEGEQNIEKQKKVINASIILHFFIAVIVAIILEIAEYFLFNGVLNIETERIVAAKAIYQFMVVSAFFSILSVPFSAVINAHENMLFVAVLGVFESLLKLSVAIYLTYTGFDKLILYGFCLGLISIFLFLARFIYCWSQYKEVRVKFVSYFDKTLFKEMYSFAGWSFLGSSTSIISNYGQGILINVFFGTRVNAAQAISAQISGQSSVFASTLLKALNPIIHKSEGAGDRQMVHRASIMGSKFSFFLLLIVYVPLIIEMPFIFDIWLKETPTYAIIFCRLLLLRNLIEQIFLTLTSMIQAVGKIKNFELVGSILNFFPLVVSFFLFELEYPPYSLYIVFIFYAILKGLNVSYFSWKLCDFRLQDFFKNNILRYLFSSILTIGISIIPVFFYPQSVGRLLFVLTLSITSFLITVWWIGFSMNERTLISKIIMDVRTTKKFNN